MAPLSISRRAPDMIAKLQEIWLGILCRVTNTCEDTWRKRMVLERDAALESANSLQPTGHIWADRLSGKTKQ